MKFKFYTSLYLRIIGIAGLIMLGNYITNVIQHFGFFGDVAVTPRCNDCVIIDKYHEWGFRHYVWFWMSAIMMIVTILRQICWAYNRLNK